MNSEKAKDIGIDVRNAPKEACKDEMCPYHGHLRVRGRMFVGTVVSDKMAHAAVVEWPFLLEIKKYERFMKKKSRVVAHNPPCINARIGDRVRIVECRPISKTKTFVIIENFGKAK